MKISDKGIALIKSFEGCVLEAYPDPGTGGDPWTIGYGHTGSEIYPGFTITQERADEYLRLDVQRFEQCVEQSLLVDVNQNQFDALVCFSFNVGCKALSGSTLLKLLNNGDSEAASQQFARWSKAGGKVMAGLVRRRDAERQLFLA